MIIFHSNRDGIWKTYVMNTDDSGEIMLTSNPANDSSSSWSPDGKMIIFQSDRDGNWEIYVINTNVQE